MPPGGDELPPADFDVKAANALISEIDRTRTLLVQQKRDRMAQGQSIRQSWKGPYAVKHDADRTSSDREAQEILDALGVLRSRVQTAIDNAQADQRRIDQHNQSLLQVPHPTPGPAPTPPR